MDELPKVKPATMSWDEWRVVVAIASARRSPSKTWKEYLARLDYNLFLVFA